jgi:ketosteroid isomerase-like protein
VVAGTDAAAVDAIGRYTDADGEVSLVSSCDIYEFRDGLVTTITSYAVEL